MNDKVSKIVVTIIGAAGLVLLLMSAFDIMPKLDNVLVFAGIVCFIVAGLIKKLVK